MIRPIMPRDVFKVTELAEMMHAESPYRRMKFDKKKLLNILLYKLNTMTLIGFVDEKNEKVIGAIIGYVDQYFFGDQYLLSSYGVYVLPDYRKSKSAAKLLRAFIGAGKDIGVKEICIRNDNAENQEAIDLLYKKVGFQKDECVHRVNV